MPDLNNVPRPVGGLIADIGQAIDDGCRTERVELTDIMSAVATILSSAIQQLEHKTAREIYLEEIVKRLRLAVYERVGNG